MRILPVCLALMLCFSACAQTGFSTQNFLEDYDAFWTVVDGNYPFLSILEEKGCNIAALRAENRVAIEARVRTLGDFADLLRDTMARMQNFAHLNLISPASYESYLELIAQGAFVADAPEIALFCDAQTRACYEELGAGGIHEQQEPDLPEVETAWYPEICAAYFGFQTFDHSLIARDRDIIADFLCTHPDAKHVIIDICGNGGGSDAYWAEVIVSPFGDAAQSAGYTYFKDSPLNRMYVQDRDVLPVSQLDALPDFVAELGLTHAVAHSVVFPMEAYSGKTVNLSLKRWVLIDGAVYSAADGFAAFCKDSGWATLVGTPAMGDGADDLRPCVFRLENTGLLVRMSTSAAANHDGSLNVLSGTRPDFPCKMRETPLQACLRLIAAGIF